MTINNNQSSQSNQNSVKTSSQAISVESIQAWLISYIAQLMDISTQEVDIQLSFENYGLDSSAAVSLIGDLENWLNIDLSPEIIFDYPNIKTLSEYLVQKVNT